MTRFPLFAVSLSLATTLSLGLNTGCKAPKAPAPKGKAVADQASEGASSEQSKKRGSRTMEELMNKKGAVLKRMPKVGAAGNTASRTAPLSPAVGASAATASTSAPLTRTTKPTAVAYDEEKVRLRAIQVALLSKELAPYWHADKPGRKPVRIAQSGALQGAKLGPHPTLKVLGEPAVIVAPKDANKPHVVIDRVAIDKLPSNVLNATIALKIPVEGVAAKGLVVGEGIRWRVQGMQVTEQ